MLHHATGKRQAPAFCFLLLILALVLAACGPAAAPEGDPPSLADAPEEPDVADPSPEEPDAVQAAPEAGAYSITEPYRDYPDIDTLFSSYSTNEERLAACQIPEEILPNMTTEALVETIFLHPLRWTLYWNTNWTEGKVMLDWMESSFNAVPELYSRADGIAVLEGWTQEKEAQYEAEESYEQYADLRIGQALLAEMQTRADWEAEHPTPTEPDVPAAPTEAGAYSVTEPYVYPVPDGTEPWAGSLDLLQMVEFYRIPEEVLPDRTTEALFQTVLDYPLLRSAAEDGGRGFVWLQESCAALPAFLARPDAAAVLADYQNTDEFRYGLTIKRNLVFFCLAELE